MQFGAFSDSAVDRNQESLLFHRDSRRLLLNRFSKSDAPACFFCCSIHGIQMVDRLMR